MLETLVVQSDQQAANRRFIVDITEHRAELVAEAGWSVQSRAAHYMMS